MRLALSLVLAAATGLSAARPTAQGTCADAAECRKLALDAAAREDYETFHDLSWRALQKGPKNDPELMRLVARAQSLSGRPHDALIMLQRLAGMGVVTDAAGSEDFRRVRALAGWAEFEKRIEELRTGPAKPADAALPGTSAPKATPPVATKPAEKPAAPKEDEPKPPLAPSFSPRATGDAGAEALRFSRAAFTPAGLAYDSVSGRFIVGDLQERKLTVVGEQSHRVDNLAGAHSAGFGEIAAFEIDVGQGDLWVATVEEGSRPTSVLHKLQLTSGRVLYPLTPAEEHGPSRFVDVTVGPSSSVLVLDGEGRRVFRATSKPRALQVAAQLEVDDPVSIAAASGSVVYVAHGRGILRVDLTSRASQAVRASAGVDLAGLAWIRWHRDSLVGIQALRGGGHRVVRVRLDGAGRRATGIRVLDRSVVMADPSAAALSGSVLYYLAEAPEAPTAETIETIIRRVTVR